MTAPFGQPLARSLTPLPDESLPGFVLRLSHRLRLPPIRIAELTGLSRDARRVSADHLLALPNATAFASATRLSIPEAHTLTLSSYAATYPPLTKIQAHTTRNAAAQRDNWAFNNSSRYCPQCLVGDQSPIQSSLGGPWKLRWHLPITFACTLHQRLLESTCPACHNPLGGSIRGRGSLIRLPGRGELHPLQCRNTAPGGKPAETTSRDHASCGARLDSAPPSAGTTLPPADLARLLALQDRLEQGLDQHRQTANDENTFPELHFLDLIITSQLIKVSWPAGSAFASSDAATALLNEHIEPITAALESQPPGATGNYLRISDLWAAPDNAAQCGALLLAAETVLGDRDPASLRERVQPLIEAAYDRAPGRIYNAIRGADFSPDMARAMVRRALTFHRGNQLPRLLGPSRDCLFDTDEIPPLLPQDWFEAHFADFPQHMINTNNWTTRHLRRAASLKLVEMTAGTYWAQSAEILGMRRGSASRTLAVLRNQIPDDATWREFEAIVEQIACALDSSPQRINYAHRRRVLATWEMPQEDWTRLCASIPKMGRMAAQNLLVGTLLVWSAVTQAEPLQCPRLNALRQTDAPETRRVSDRVAQLLTPSRQMANSLVLRHCLNQYAADLAARCDSRTNPLSPS